MPLPSSTVMVAFLGIDDLLHLGQLFSAESFHGQSVRLLRKFWQKFFCGKLLPSRMLRVKMLPVLLSLIFICGCSPQKALAQRLKGTDRLIVTNLPRGPRVTVTGEEVGKVVQAIATGKKLSRFVDAAPELRLEFFRKGEHLATITNSVDVFWIGKTPYKDATGTLRNLYEKPL